MSKLLLELFLYDIYLASYLYNNLNSHCRLSTFAHHS